MYFDLSSRLRQSRGSAFFQVLEQFKRSVQSVGADLPVWIVTNLAVRNALPLEPSLFDLVIIDEASQCDIPSALPLLFRARRALIIGDPQQLQHISTLSQSEEQTLAVRHKVDRFVPKWSYNQRSLYDLAEGAIFDRGEQPFFLAEHYRSHPEIIEFSNRRFYQGQLIPRTSLGSLSERIGNEHLGLFWHDVRGSVPSSSRSAVNDIEVTAVLDLLEEWAQSGFLMRDTVDFGIVTPFRLQTERLEEAVRGRPWWQQVRGRLTVGTAHRFQGDERDVMIFSPVVSNGMLPRLVRWVSETDQLLNVAITRARGALHVVGDIQACLTAGGSLGDFAASVQTSSGSRHVVPVFGSPAEARMAELLAEVGLWFTPQLPIGGYFLDFLVVTPLGTRYALEVDGRGHLNDEQARRDRIKDAAVLAAGYRVFRLDARRIFNNEDGVRELLRRLV
jgi:very-short-patch-repair endonuclease